MAIVELVAPTIAGIGSRHPVVTDTGGILSHPAIIAREHGIPAVVGTGNATSVLTDGQRVIVDGSTGFVELADAPSRES